MNENDPVKILDKLYLQAIDGIPGVSEPIEKLVDDYMSKHTSTEAAIDDMVKYQITKCGTSGFLSGLGGVIVLPIAIPANISSVLYVQMRMIAAIAVMRGYNINSDQVRTLVYVSLTGTAAADILKQAGIKIGEKMTNSIIMKIPGKVCRAINKKVGFMLLTKAGEKGAVNLVKLVPLIGGFVGGVVDIYATNKIAKTAKKIFKEGNEYVD